MINDDDLRARLETIETPETRPNPARVGRGISSKQARRGTPEFDDLMDELEDEWELDEDELDNIVELRRAGDSFEIRLKGETRWELLEDDEEDEDSDDEDSVAGPDEDFDGAEEEYPGDREVIDPLQVHTAQVQDPDPEIIQDPAVRLALAATGTDVAELVKQDAEEVAFRQTLRQRQGADRVRVVEGVHQATLTDQSGVHLPEQHDLAATDGELRPGERTLGFRDEVPDQLEGKLQTPARRTLTGRES
jgi:hypothetical protein